VAERWDAIRVVSYENDIPMDGMEAGKVYNFKYVIDEQGLDDAIGLEIVCLKSDPAGEDRINDVTPFKVTKREGNLFTFESQITMPNAGAFKVAYRMFPKNVDLPHRQDFCYVKWFI
jgi:starch phosphorylase